MPPDSAKMNENIKISNENKAMKLKKKWQDFLKCYKKNLKNLEQRQ